MTANKDKAEKKIESLKAKIEKGEDSKEVREELAREQRYVGTLQGEIDKEEDRLKAIESREPWRNSIYVWEGTYYMAHNRRDHSKGFRRIDSHDVLTTELQEMGLSSAADRAGGSSQVSRAKRAIGEFQSVIWAGVLGGHEAGVKPVGNPKNNQSILVTTTTHVLEAKAGECEYSRQFIEGLFGKNTKYAYAWIRAHYVALCQSVSGKAQRPVPAWVISGQTGCGKTLFAQTTLMEIFGCCPESSVNPIKYATGGTNFNKELAGSVFHLVDDDMTDTTLKQRKAVGNDLKKGSATTSVRLEGKFQDPINLPVTNRKVILVNDEMESLQVLPPINETLKDKILILRANQFDFPPFPPKWDGVEGTDDEWQARREVLIEEAPALLHWILNEWVMPPGIKGGRYGFQVIQDDHVISSMCDVDPEEQLRELLEVHWKESKLRGRVGPLTSREIYNDHALVLGFEGLVHKDPKILGRYLGRLAAKYPENYEKHERKNGKDLPRYSFKRESLA
jgi:hypothetical protein